MLSVFWVVGRVLDLVFEGWTILVGITVRDLVFGFGS